jgi:hypothetical protein
VINKFTTGYAMTMTKALPSSIKSSDNDTEGVTSKAVVAIHEALEKGSPALG